MKIKNSKYVFSVLVLPLLSVFLYSCEGDTIDSDRVARTLKLKAEIGEPTTRASNASWEKDDAIGVYMVKSGQPLNTSSLRQNVEYVTSGSTSFNPGKDVEEIALPFDESHVDFISYYPYRGNIDNFSYPIDLMNQSVQSKIDLLYSNNAKGFNSKNPNVRMQFTHQLSRIVLKIAKDASVNLKELSVRISNTGTKATFNLSTGELSAAQERGSIEFLVDNNGSAAEAILLPETDLSDMELWFIVNEEESEIYKLSLADVFEINAFEKSTLYTYNVTLFAEKTAIITESNISPWIDGPSANANANSTTDSPPLIKGSKKTPFTVAEAQSNQGRTEVWVEGFIVGYFSSSTMNSFSTDLSGDISQSNLALATFQNETDLARIIPVMLGSGKIRDELNLRTNPDNFNKKVKIKGDLGEYFKAPGLRNIKQYEFIAQ